MVSFGGRGGLDQKYGEPPDFFALVLDGDVIEIEGYYKDTFPTKYTKIVSYEMTRVVLLKRLEEKIDMVRKMMSDALKAEQKGQGFPTETVHVEFTKIYYV